MCRGCCGLKTSKGVTDDTSRARDFVSGPRHCECPGELRCRGESIELPSRRDISLNPVDKSKLSIYPRILDM